MRKYGSLLLRVFAFPPNPLIANFKFFFAFLKHCLRMCTLEKFLMIESPYHVVETRQHVKTIVALMFVGKHFFLP